MDTTKLKKFAQAARQQLLQQVAARFEQVSAPDSFARREHPKAVKELDKRLRTSSREQIIEEAAYTWFNRFCALRYMDINNYTRIGTVSPQPGFTQPEILQEAKQGHISDEFTNYLNPQKVFDLLSGQIPAADPQQEAYRILLVAVCNRYNQLMPFMFEAIADFTELLMPDDLLSENSVLHSLREAVAVGAVAVGAVAVGAVAVGSEKWEVGSDGESSHSPLSTSHSSTSLEVEVIGWLYQFYISEKKDEVFAGLKKNKKITPENIPAATQLFTPHWIVKYLVENSLGRLWMLNRPESKLIDRMEYYIQPDTSVGSEKWKVESGGKEDGSQELSGVDRLAESNGFGENDLPGNQTLSQRRTLRTDQPDTPGGGVNSIQYSRGSSSTIDGGIQEFSLDSPRFPGRSGNPDHDSSTTELPLFAADKTDSEPKRGNQTHDLFTNQQTVTANFSHPASHSPLPTPHLRISSPEEIRILDPACGSGHMLTYAFDLLYAIYEEEGYENTQIPQLILTHNLYGIEIDQRAGALAAFALFMKAREKSRRFFRKPVQPQICVLRNVSFDDEELSLYSGKWGVGSEKQETLYHDLKMFEEADNFGSLLRPVMPLEDIETVKKTLHSTLSTSHSLFEHTTLSKTQIALEQASYLSPKYHVVIANPPYMGGKGMNGRLGAWVKDNYPDSKSDLFAAFIERNLDLTRKQGLVAMITMQSWMFLSSFEKLRTKILDNDTILSMAHLGARAFDSIGGEVVSTTAFVLENAHRPEYKGAYIRLVDGMSEAEKDQMLRNAIKTQAE